MWLTAEEQEIYRPELGIDRRGNGGAAVGSGDQQAASAAVGGAWLSRARHWMDACAAAAKDESPQASLKTLVLRVLEAGKVYHHKEGKSLKGHGTESFDLNAIPFGFSSSLAYIFPASLVELWMEVAQKAVDRDVGEGEWSDKEVVRHYLYNRAACTSLGGGIQPALVHLPTLEANIVRKRLNRLLLDVSSCLSLDSRNYIWVTVLMKSIEAIHDNSRCWLGETAEKRKELERVLHYGG